VPGSLVGEVLSSTSKGNSVRAREFASPFPTVGLSTPAIEAARLLAGQNLPGLIVVDEQGRPFTVLPGTQVLRMAVPQYVLDDPTLARVVDEAAADVFLRGLGERTVVQCLPVERRELPVVGPDATVLEIAALMARSRTPLVAVFAPNEGLLGAVTLDALLDRLLAS
jgi:CBS domain-containing protein